MDYRFSDHFKDEPLDDAARDYLFQDFDAEDPEEIKARAFFKERGAKFDFTVVGVDVYDGVNDDALIIEKFEKTLKSGAHDAEFERLYRHRVYVTIIRQSGKIIGFDESAIPED